MTSARLNGVDVWDGHTHLGPSTIQWRGDEIELVEAADESGTGFCVIPGLVDTHVHLGGYAGEGKVDWSTWPLITPREEHVFHMASHAQRAARLGVTTLRDLGADERQFAVARAFDAGLIQGPRVLGHGAVGMTAGHGDLFVPPHYPHRDRVADTPDECRKLVRQYARMGAHGIKIYTSGGVLSQGDKVSWRNQTMAELEATIDEAHALGLPVAAHAHTAGGIEIALSIGVDSLEHGTGLGPATIPAAVERNLPVAPTLLINDRIASGSLGLPQDAVEKALDVVARRDEAFGQAAAAGVRFVLGTDANGVMVDFGDQMEEVRLMQRHFGWTAERALRSATSDAADVVGLGAAVGTIAPGYGADLVVLRGRPWEDIADLATSNIVAVVSRGAVVAGSLPTTGNL